MTPQEQIENIDALQKTAAEHAQLIQKLIAANKALKEQIAATHITDSSSSIQEGPAEAKTDVFNYGKKSYQFAAQWAKANKLRHPLTSKLITVDEVCASPDLKKVFVDYYKDNPNNPFLKQLK